MSINLREEIKKIQNNKDLTNIDKNKLIQNLMMNNKSYINNEIKECTHYPTKKCNYFYFDCCNQFANCIRCHNEMDDSHKPELTNITCDNCKLFQKPNDKCENCKIIFNKSYCDICYIWTDKDIYHCKKCGICRVGVKDKSFHCDSCDTCFNTSIIEHKCPQNLSYRDKTCGFCLDNIHDSQLSTFSLSCSHIVHLVCYKDALKNEQHRCPICRKSICEMNWNYIKEMIRIQPMPQDITIGDEAIYKYFGKIIVTDINEDMYSGYFENFGLHNKVYGTFHKNDLKKYIKDVNILCYDCSNKSCVKFHYFGLECLYCGSFNTSLL